ncbi:WGR domain-containing protein [Rhizobium sp. C1]|uniref:WGR domain-containing protein n=1 Tax=Rhizobium sp. C1 TaxID=1349799 RepID=UPI001E4EA175|nr:WGR domain-containing protein [Rhizobium sp. C1]MCD2178761.1 WGR domain-containing protein [Rhizobium sp. C1]
MTTISDDIYLERRDPAKNMARFYMLSIEPTLFGDVRLRRHWGRIGTRGQVKLHDFAKREEAAALLARLLRAKRRRGYGEA